MIERLFIDAESHRLEAIYSRPPESSRGVFVLCHPHPVYGGNMHHKVMVKTAEMLLDHGFSAVRFNMRGTGKSTGTQPDHAGNREDLCTVLHWTMEQCGDAPLWLAGYSYGAFIALSSLVRRIPGSFAGTFPVQGVLALAFPAGFPECKLDLLPEVKISFVHGTEDELIPASVLKSYMASQPQARPVQWIAGANHLFDGKMPDLQTALKISLDHLMRIS